MFYIDIHVVNPAQYWMVDKPKTGAKSWSLRGASTFGIEESGERGHQLLTIPIQSELSFSFHGEVLLSGVNYNCVTSSIGVIYLFKHKLFSLNALMDYRDD